MNTGPKLRQVQCVEPELVVDLKNTGNLGWRYTFEWEANRYDWERSSSSLLGSERAFTLSIVSEPYVSTITQYSRTRCTLLPVAQARSRLSHRYLFAGSQTQAESRPAPGLQYLSEHLPVS